MVYIYTSIGFDLTSYRWIRREMIGLIKIETRDRSHLVGFSWSMWGEPCPCVEAGSFIISHPTYKALDFDRPCGLFGANAYNKVSQPGQSKCNSIARFGVGGVY